MASRNTSATSRGLTIPRVFSTEGVHPFDEVEWELRDVVQTNWKTGEKVFEQTGVEFPSFWSMNATTIATTKYFRGALGTPAREHSLKQLISRVVDAYVASGIKEGYFDKANASIFSDELTWVLLHQYVAFNSPVWFNVGTSSDPQISACFLLDVDDSMSSILDWYKEEGMIFKGGSGAGVNLSKIRSSKELLSSGGTASGPISFMRGADASAGTIKSGGATRRAAKMVALDINHPDIEEFVTLKVREEEKIRALRDAGFDMDLGGADITSVQYQNANNSVQVNDTFMKAVEDGTSYQLKARTTDQTWGTDARALFRKIAEAAWACADPGVQFSDTINQWHTIPAEGRIMSSNPCGEYLSIPNSSCNLASINLMKFLNEDGTFDDERFTWLCRLMITAMDISICFGSFPTQKITENTKKYRQLGLGYANLGALLMATGHGYDTDGGRNLAAAITSLMAAAAHEQSIALAKVVGPYDGWSRNKKSHVNVVKMHQQAAGSLNPRPETEADRIMGRSAVMWASAVADLRRRYGAMRNSQLSLLAPTGTIGFLMDCDTTGVEPDFALVKFKKLVGGGSMQIVNQTVELALDRLDYDETQRNAIVDFVAEHGNVIGAPYLKQEHYEVFDCAVGERAIAPMGHVRMMAAIQPFLSGAISKTVNMPENTTVDEVEEIHMQAWKLGLKSLAIYRDNCKVGQPLSTKKTEAKDPVDKADEVWEKIVEKVVYKPTRERLPKKRTARTVSFTVGGAEGYLTTGEYEDGRLGEVFLKFGKQGSTLSGVMDAFSIVTSVALQYGVPLSTLIEKFVNMRFEPAGMTDDPDLRMAQSLMDYVFRRLALDYLPFEDRSELGIYSADERKRFVETGSYELADDEERLIGGDEVVYDKPVTIHKAQRPTQGVPVEEIPVPDSIIDVHSTTELAERIGHISADAPLCMTCGTKMQRAGSCHVCEGCGSTSGCS